ncbi:MAG: exodeoxyribonuclease V beta subunit, partial [Myxococcota bacterium]
MSLQPFDAVAHELTGATHVLEASAGTGKTWNIEAMVVRLVAERDLDISTLLVVTFTRAATAELRERVRSRLQATLRMLRGEVPATTEFEQGLAQRREADPEGSEWPRRIRDALLAFDSAQIFTIHGFCQRVLQRYALQCSTEFDEQLVGDADAQIQGIARDYWELHTRDIPRAFYGRLTGNYGVNIGALSAIGAAVMSAPDAPFEPARTGRPATTPDDWDKAIAEAAVLWRNQRADFLAAIEPLAPGLKIEMGGRLHGNAAKLDEWFADPGAWGKGAGKPPKYVRMFTTVGLCSQAKKATKTRPEFVPPALPFLGAMDALFKAAEAYERDHELWVRDFLLEFAEYARARLEVRQNERGERCYETLLTRLAASLDAPGTGPNLATAIRSEYGAALIDEFQDTDPTQWHIFRRLFVDAPGYPVYLIGDPKQSIYAFRGADIRAYHAARDNADGPTFTLNRSYRSDRPLVAAVRHLFTRPMLRDAFVDDKVTYTHIEAVHEVRVQSAAGPLPAMQLSLVPREPGEEGPLKVSEARPRIAAAVARDVASMLNERHELTGATSRLVGPSDIAVLVRTHMEAAAVRDELLKANIPSVTHSTDSVLRQEEANEFRELLWALVEPSDGRRIRAALAGRIMGATADQIDGLDADEAEWDRWGQRFRQWRTRWEKQGLADALAGVLTDCDTAARWLARPLGARRWTNLQHLVEVVHRAATEARLEPQGAVEWLEARMSETKAYGPDEHEEEPEQFWLRLETDADAVEICTMHSAKGRQWPIVLCPFLWRAEKITSHKRALRYYVPDTPALCGFDIGIPADRDEYTTRMTEAWRNAYAEGMRLAYVALTRAQHRTLVYTAPVLGLQNSAIGYLLHQHDAQPGESARATVTRRLMEPTDHQLKSDLERVAADSDGTIEVAVSEYSTALKWVGPDTHAAQPLQVQTWSGRRLDGWWRRASFSGLVGSSHGTSAGEGRDHDADNERDQRFDRDRIPP